MNAEYAYERMIHHFTVGTEQREDDTVGPPYRTPLSLRECAAGPVAVLSLVLHHVDAERDVAVYRVTGRQILKAT